MLALVLSPPSPVPENLIGWPTPSVDVSAQVILLVVVVVAVHAIGLPMPVV